MYTPSHTTPLFSLSLHDALPIFPHELDLGIGERLVLHDLRRAQRVAPVDEDHLRGKACEIGGLLQRRIAAAEDRKSTRLNSSHLVISYAVFCLIKKKYI